MRRTLGLAGACALVLVTAGLPLGRPAAAPEVREKPLLDNNRILMVEYTFPAGFRGDEHAAVADEFAYVLEGELTVVTQGQGRRVVRRGEVEYASKGTLHYSLNEGKRPARVLVVYLKER